MLSLGDTALHEDAYFEALIKALANIAGDNVRHHSLESITKIH